MSSSARYSFLRLILGPSKKSIGVSSFPKQSLATRCRTLVPGQITFQALLGAIPDPLVLFEQQIALKARLYDAAPKGTADDMAELNSPVSLEEAQACMLLPTGRAADLQGLTGELLRGACPWSRCWSSSLSPRH
jgi:hypothetical protein